MARAIPRRRPFDARAVMAVALCLSLGLAEWSVRRAECRSGAPAPSLRSAAIDAFTGKAGDAIRAAPGVEFSLDPVAALRADQARSIDRVLGELDANFDRWRERSESLADSLLGWGTRGSLAWRSVRSALGGPDDLRRSLVAERFRTLVLDEAELMQAIERAHERMRLELRADRARAHARVRRGVEWIEGGRSDSASVASSSLEPMGERLHAELLRSADRSLVRGVLAVIGATVVTEVVAVSLGAAAGGAAAGAAGGSVVPGVGTAVGFVAGLGAGIAVDWWMHARTREEIVRRCADAVDRLRSAIIRGEPSLDRPGLRPIFEQLAERDAKRFEAELAEPAPRAQAIAVSRGASR